jgi:hypothetical protein
VFHTALPPLLQQLLRAALPQAADASGEPTRKTANSLGEWKKASEAAQVPLILTQRGSSMSSAACE